MLSARDPLPALPSRVLFHGPGWTPRERFEADVAELVSAECWVTEWQYHSARPVLAARAQLLVWLDLPFRVTLWRVVARTVRRSRSKQVERWLRSLGRAD